MQFGYTIIYVLDVEKALAFYEEAFGLKRKFLHESKEYGELETGKTVLAFASEKLVQGLPFTPNRSGNLASGFEIALVTSDISKAYGHAVSAGAVALKEPEQKPWGQWVAYVRDLNGVVVEICTPIHG